MPATPITTAMFPTFHWSRTLVICALLWLAAIMTGCATQPGSAPANTSDLATLENWRLEGKLGFRSPNKNGSAWLRWQQQGSAYELQLNGPFGAASTAIKGDSHFAVLSQSGREDLTAENGEALSTQLFGWPFPVAELAFWAKGLAAPTSAATATTDSANLLTTLQQQGWQLEFSDYAVQGSWTLPTRIKGTRDDYGFTLVIKKWVPGSQQPEH